MCPSGRHHNGLYAHHWGQACDSVCGALPHVFLSLISTLLPSGRLRALTGPVMKRSDVCLFLTHTETHMQKYIQKHMSIQTWAGTASGKVPLILASQRLGPSGIHQAQGPAVCRTLRTTECKVTEEMVATGL